MTIAAPGNPLLAAGKGGAIIDTVLAVNFHKTRSSIIQNFSREEIARPPALQLFRLSAGQKPILYCHRGGEYGSEHHAHIPLLKQVQIFIK